YQTRVGADGSTDSWWGHRGADGTAHWHRIDDGAVPGDIGPWGAGTAGEKDAGGEPLPGPCPAPTRPHGPSGPVWIGAHVQRPTARPVMIGTWSRSSGAGSRAPWRSVRCWTAG